MIHYGDDGAFEEAYWEDAHLVGDPNDPESTDLWGSTSATLRAYPNAERAKFSLRLEKSINDGMTWVGAQVLFADEALLRDIREAINVALGED